MIQMHKLIDPSGAVQGTVTLIHRAASRSRFERTAQLEAASETIVARNLVTTAGLEHYAARFAGSASTPNLFDGLPCSRTTRLRLRWPTLSPRAARSFPAR